MASLADALASRDPAANKVDPCLLPLCACLRRFFRSSAPALVAARISGENGSADRVLRIAVGIKERAIGQDADREQLSVTIMDPLVSTHRCILLPVVRAAPINCGARGRRARP